MPVFGLCSSAGPLRERDSLYSWMVCVCATMTWVASLGLLFSFGVFLPVFMDYFKASREITAWIGSVAIAVNFLAGRLSTALTARFGCRVTSLIGGAICVMSFTASSFVDNILVLFFTYSIVFGLGCSCINAAGLVVIGQVFKKRRSLATGVLVAGHGGGMLVMGPTLEVLISAHGWQTTFRIAAGVAFVLCSLAITYDPNVETDEEEGRSSKETDDEDERNKKIINTRKNIMFDSSVWKEPPFVALVLSVSVVMFGYFVPQIHLIRHCEDLGISSEKGSKLFIYFGLCSAITRLIAGLLCNHPRVNAFFVLQAAEFVAGVSTILVTLASTYTPLIVYAVIYGLSDGFYFTSFSCLLYTVSPSKAATVIGWKMMMVSIFLVSGPPLAGLLADKLGSYVIPFQVAGGIIIAGGFIPFVLLCYKRPGNTASKQQGKEDKRTKSNSFGAENTDWISSV